MHQSQPLPPRKGNHRTALVEPMVPAKSPTMTVTTTDHWMESIDAGKLFARQWTPSNACRSHRETIVLFHDSLGCVELWRDFPQNLATATRRSVVAYDRLGFGRSDAHPGILPKTFIRDEASLVVPRLCESLGLGAIIPFGHSVGGGMAIATAAHLPASCAAVITESAQSFIEDTTLSGLLAGKMKFQAPDQFERLKRYHGEKARWVLDAWIDTWLAPDFADWSLDHDLPAVRCPALVLHGERDEYGSRRHADRIASLTSGPSQTLILEGCGHVPHREQPALILKSVALFLSQYGSQTDAGDSGTV